MGGFKIIGIQPLKNCNLDLLKGLTKNEIFLFYNDYKFQKDQFNIVELITKPDFELDIFSNKEGQTINISAIVGENGSGKSTILELLYIIALCLSKDQKKIKDELKKIGSKNNIIGGFVMNAINSLHAELFYTTQKIESNKDTEVRSIKFENGKIAHYIFAPKRSNLEVEFNLHQFCYSVSLNYSLYGLNEIHTPWLAPMFHKNDGYQAPLVINPYRTNGLIDVNKENDLSNYRLILNAVESEEESYEIVNEKYIDEIEFYLDPKSLFFIYWENQKIRISSSKNEYKTKHNESIYSLINLVIRKFNLSKNDKGKKREISELDNNKITILEEIGKLGIDHIIERISNGNIVNNDDTEFKNYLEFLFLEYITKKIYKLYLLKTRSPMVMNTIRGETFNEFFIQLESKEKLISFINEITKDNSHLTLKLRQMLFLWDSNFFTKSTIHYSIVTKNEDYSDKNKDFYLMTQQSLSGLKGYFSTIAQKGALNLELVPCGIFKPKIKYTPVNSNKKDTTTFSSGELQLIFTIQTVLYHLRNINSVQKSGVNNKILYKNINLIFDEIEICFHPNFQRIFINELIRNIEKLEIPNIKSINILFSTHSPFILSDIPATNILRLEDGSPSKKPFSQTFGANIHELLANDFFLKKGFMGEFAKAKINSIINSINYHSNEIEIKKLQTKIDNREKLETYENSKLTYLKDYKLKIINDLNDQIMTKVEIEKLVEIIGEPLIQNKINQMFKSI